MKKVVHTLKQPLGLCWTNQRCSDLQTLAQWFLSCQSAGTFIAPRTIADEPNLDADSPSQNAVEVHEMVPGPLEKFLPSHG